jgi:hypothetical protein
MEHSWSIDWRRFTAFQAPHWVFLLLKLDFFLQQSANENSIIIGPRVGPWSKKNTNGDANQKI